jgi:enamine deaminase RidA (YjgF/YER057c/UK114 family)
MSLNRHNPTGLARPSGYSHAVSATGSRLVFLAGQTALDADGKISADGIVGQFEIALGNLLAALADAGGGPEHLTRVTIYTVDVQDYKAHSAEIGNIWRWLIGGDYPAMALIGVSRLWDAEALVELDGIAVLP